MIRNADVKSENSRMQTEGRGVSGVGRKGEFIVLKLFKVKLFAKINCKLLKRYSV